MRKSNNTVYIVAGVLVVAAVVLFMMSPSIKLGYKDYKNKEGFQTVADVKLARARASAEGFASTRVGRSKEGFQAMNTSNIIAANPLPMNIPKPAMSNVAQQAAPSAPSVVTLANNAQMPTLPTITANALSNVMMPNMPAAVVAAPSANNMMVQKFTNMNDTQGSEYRKGAKEGFTSGNYGMTAGGARDSYTPIGGYDNVRLSPSNNVSSWRNTAPNEALLGDPFEVDQDNLFIFKNNQCKPECCGASFSCSGGCVCTTPDQRQYIASRGGNRTSPQED